MADEDDPVVKEMEVYLSKSLAENLYLFQYPIRPSNMLYTDIHNLAARFKPKQKKVELELLININGATYDRSKGEQISLNVDGHNHGTDDSYFNSSYMDKQVLSSEPVAQDMSPYAAAYFKENELHLTPLRSIMHLRPSFSYLDRSDSKQKQESQDAGESSQDEAEEEAKPVVVRFARVESEQAKQKRMLSYDYIQKKKSEEAWINVRFHSHDKYCEVEKNHLVFIRSDNEPPSFQVEAMDYLKTLVAATEADELAIQSSSTATTTLVQLKIMPLSDQIRHILINTSVIEFHHLMSLLPTNVDSISVLRCVQQFAVLIQGCWVVKSELLYSKDSKSFYNDVPAELMCRARDYLLWKFTQNRLVLKKDFMNIVRLPHDEVDMMLKAISNFRPLLGWEFVLEQDTDFISKYTEVVQRQQMLWEAKHLQFCKQLRVLKDTDLKSKDDGQPSARQRNRSRSHSQSHSSSVDVNNVVAKSGSTTMEVDRNHVREDRLEAMDTSTTIVNNHIQDETIIVNSVKDDIPSFLPSAELKKELLAFIRDKLQSRMIITLSELKRSLQLKLAQSQPGHILGTGVSDKLLEQTIIESGSVRLENQWPPNSKEEPIFALVSIGDNLDQQRGIILELFKTNYRIRLAQYKKNLESIIGVLPSDNECRKLLKDYCVTKNCQYYLKGTIDT